MENEIITSEANIGISKSLKIYIDGNDWNTDKFSNVFNGLKNIRNYVIFHELLHDALLLHNNSSEVEKFDPKEAYMFSWRLITNNPIFHEPIKVESIKYSSPGWIELVFSAGTVIAVLNLIKHYVPNRKEKLEQAKIEIELTEKYIGMLRDLGYPDNVVKNFVESFTLKKLVRLSLFAIKDLMRMVENGDIKTIEEKEKE